MIHKFVVSYERHISTANQEVVARRKTAIEFDRKPGRKDFPAIERMLGEKLLRQHSGNLGNPVYVSFKVKRVA